ncbi:hypothetical protein [Maledivibacter halophilus]|uniref:Uncharacterized protein n=1 Tax=Maledivibacter halophilus TaxID=36842 RepID=A0A1T5KZ71_9FIRM|nr:hypothetical protein [Maledivibacter halophilus]SKC68755.1 hypothetical protein SAMN02194393_02183 [Maledivibacter halophilus]
MIYRIDKIHCPGKDFINIDKDEYEQIIKSKEKLFEVLYIEEKFDFILTSYEEFESELLTIALKAVIYDNYEWDNLANDIRIMDRRIINLLSVCRLYFDHTSNSLSKLYGKQSDKYQKFQISRNYEYDNNLAYRMMEGLRNHIQHNNLSIHKLLYSRRSKDLKKDNELLNSAAIYMAVDKLKNDNALKKKVLSELKTEDGFVDIRPYIRSYLSSITKIHDDMKKKLRRDLEKCENVYNETIEKYYNKFSHNEISIGVMRIDEHKKAIDSISILNDVIKRRKELEKKNSGIKFFHEVVISNK